MICGDLLLTPSVPAPSLSLSPPQVVQMMAMPAHHFPVGSSLTSLHLCSDGTYLYWVWSPVSLNEKTQKGHSVFMDVFQLSVRPPYRLTTSSHSCLRRSLCTFLIYAQIVCVIAGYCIGVRLTKTQSKQ